MQCLWANGMPRISVGQGVSGLLQTLQLSPFSSLDGACLFAHALPHLSGKPNTIRRQSLEIRVINRQQRITAVRAEVAWPQYEDSVLHCPVAGFAIQTSAQEKQALRLVQRIPLPGVTGRLDHMGVDLEKSACLWPPLQTIPWKLWTWLAGK